MAFSLELAELREAGVDLSGSGVFEALERRLSQSPVVLAQDHQARSWQRYLLRASDPGGDALPDVILPARLCERTPRLKDFLRTQGSELDMARRCEAAAAGESQTVAEFVLEAVGEARKG